MTVASHRPAREGRSCAAALTTDDRGQYEGHDDAIPSDDPLESHPLASYLDLFVAASRAAFS